MSAEIVTRVNMVHARDLLLTGANEGPQSLRTLRALIEESLGSGGEAARELLKEYIGTTHGAGSLPIELAVHPDPKIAESTLKAMAGDQPGYINSHYLREVPAILELLINHDRSGGPFFQRIVEAACPEFSKINPEQRNKVFNAIIEAAMKADREDIHSLVGRILTFAGPYNRHDLNVDSNRLAISYLLGHLDGDERTRGGNLAFLRVSVDHGLERHSTPDNIPDPVTQRGARTLGYLVGSEDKKDVARGIRFLNDAVKKGDLRIVLGIENSDFQSLTTDIMNAAGVDIPPVPKRVEESWEVRDARRVKNTASQLFLGILVDSIENGAAKDSLSWSSSRGDKPSYPGQIEFYEQQCNIAGCTLKVSYEEWSQGTVYGRAPENFVADKLRQISFTHENGTHIELSGDDATALIKRLEKGGFIRPLDS